MAINGRLEHFRRPQGRPLYRARRTQHTGADLLTEKQKDRLAALFFGDEHTEVEVTWWIYQRMVAAYREPDEKNGRALMVKLSGSISHGVPPSERDRYAGHDLEEACR